MSSKAYTGNASAPPLPPLLLVVCGLAREASLASAPVVTTLAGGGSRAALNARLAGLDPRAFTGVVSFGLAGALTPELAVGDIVVPARCLSEAGEIPVSPVDTLVLANLHVRQDPDAAMVGLDNPAVTANDKAALARRYGAVAIDMESHIAGAWARHHGLPFAILRVISDGANRDLPPLVTVAMRPDGGLDLPAILRSLARTPGQIPALVATARDARAAFRVLRRVGGLLGRGSFFGHRDGLVGLDL